MVPDFPGGGLIVGRSGIKNIFETGQGVVKLEVNTLSKKIMEELQSYLQKFHIWSTRKN